MQTHPTPHPPSPARSIGSQMRLVGWLSFWLQLAFAVGAGLVLLFAISGRRFNQAFSAPGVAEPATTTAGIGIGIFWAVCGIAVLLFGTFVAFRYIGFGKRLRREPIDTQPSKAETTQLLRLGVLTGLLGVLLTILGVGGTLAVLLAKAVSQPQGVALYDPNRIIRAMDVFVGMANANGLAGNFLGLLSSLWLSDRVGRA